MSMPPLLRAMPDGSIFWHPASLIATWGGVGLIRVASGTWGSLAALPFAWGLALVGGTPALVAASVAACLLGLWAAGHICRSGETDSSAIVIDEVAGQWLAVAPAMLDPILWLTGFLSFRLFDILKPWPAGWIDRNLGGAPGVMLDDMVAGAYAAGVVLLVALWL